MWPSKVRVCGVIGLPPNADLRSGLAQCMFLIINGGF